VSGVVLPAEGAPEFEKRGRRRRPPWIIAVCLLIMLGVVIMAAFGTLIAPDGAMAQHLNAGLVGPNSTYWLGTDELGRDILSRLIVGAQAALIGPAVVALISFVVGNSLGLVAGYFGGRTDSLIMRWVDLMLALPGLLVAVVVVGAVGGGYWMAVLVMALLFIPFDTRVIRGATLEQAPRPYVEAAVASGVPRRRIILLHIWPNVSATALANTFLLFALALVALSALSFLGFGAGPGSPNWGVMLAENRTFLFINPAAALAPAVMIVLVATSINLIGDWVYERLTARGVTR
jgi:peptide/nickel transport system permease protein